MMRQIDENHYQCSVCGLVGNHKMDCQHRYTNGVAEGWITDDDEDDFLTGVTCNPDAPEECESCQ